ncbi:ubiquinol-cytochrome c reductase iron-sulfur subunit [Mucilaginibacter sp. UR6-11]|uniref:QcrA and Rieske domain-containing protein n=1 Tax=Mucilaginibacter sp. UR6-11 TaxID=1435644 RepID=UPI001E337B43|nr:Rieske 2Fe-2S domain-containing protein [Mucilaginibacter sp. UR6-11]MCC8427154.1 Rieske 2Fe-2S domain-containing protein [Mucilaginibacter sp. UR6-11]
MERDEFLSKLGIGALAACMGCSLIACSKSGDANPSGGNNTTTPPVGTTFSIDLNSTLTSVGDSKVSNGIILVRIAAGNAASSFTAVQVACTHEGTAINYNNNQGLFICPLHGSEFSKSGALIQGPATTSLKQYTVAVTGSTLTVTV